MAGAQIDRRLIPVLLAGCALVVLCAWRVSANRPAGYNTAAESPPVWGPAPRFEALDSHNQMFRLERYLGRHRVLVVFVPGRQDAIELTMRQLLQHGEALDRRDVKLVVLSPALPQQHRKWLESLGESSIPVITDVQEGIAARWGVLGADRVVTFLVDRKGDVAWSNNAPRPAGDLAVVLDQLTTDRVSR
jgi:peroxiredoxin